jgi:hypothetical protein
MQKILNLIVMVVCAIPFAVTEATAFETWTGVQGGIWVPMLTACTIEIISSVAQATASGSAHTRAKPIMQAQMEQKINIPPAAGAGQPLSLAPIGERNALHEAVRRGDTEAVRRLLAEGADPNWTDALGRTALHYAARQGYSEIVEALFERNAKVNLPDQDGFEPLHRAIQGGHRVVAERLIAQGADRSARTKQGDTPLDIATRNGNQAIIELLRAN